MNGAKTQLRLDVTIIQEQLGGSLRFSEEVYLRAEDFEALAKVLSRFHDLFEEIKRQQGAA